MDLIELVDASMPWGREALCAQEPYSDWTWVTEPSMGRENPAAAVKLLEVCERCPVRAPCLRIALEEIRFDVYGAWGGTMRTERHQVTTVIRTSEEMAYADTRAEHVEHAFELLFHTLPARLNGWRHLAKLHRIEMARTAPERNRRIQLRKLENRASVTVAALRPAGSCRTCDRTFDWRKRGDARFCSSACRQNAYRRRRRTRPTRPSDPRRERVDASDLSRPHHPATPAGRFRTTRALGVDDAQLC